MSAREWKSGDVVAWKTSGGDLALAVRSHRGEWNGLDARGDTYLRRASIPAAARPLVVIDPEDREQVERFHYALFGKHPHDVDRHQIGFDQTADALRSLVTPPKPDEPKGRYAAVETVDGLEYVRLGDGPAPWMHNGSPSNRDTYSWSEIAAVRVLSDGVTS